MFNRNPIAPRIVLRNPHGGGGHGGGWGARGVSSRGFAPFPRGNWTGQPWPWWMSPAAYPFVAGFSDGCWAYPTPWTPPYYYLPPYSYGCGSC